MWPYNIKASGDGLTKKDAEHNACLLAYTKLNVRFFKFTLVWIFTVSAFLKLIQYAFEHKAYSTNYKIKDTSYA